MHEQCECRGDWRMILHILISFTWEFFECDVGWYMIIIDPCFKKLIDSCDGIFVFIVKCTNKHKDLLLSGVLMPGKLFKCQVGVKFCSVFINVVA